jgi:hypothetical protein
MSAAIPTAPFSAEGPNLIEWFWNKIHRYTFGHFPGTNAYPLLDTCRLDNCPEKSGVW